jgi:hypothetical protein
MNNIVYIIYTILISQIALFIGKIVGSVDNSAFLRMVLRLRIYLKGWFALVPFAGKQW